MSAAATPITTKTAHRTALCLLTIKLADPRTLPPEIAFLGLASAVEMGAVAGRPGPPEPLASCR